MIRVFSLVHKPRAGDCAACIRGTIFDRASRSASSLSVSTHLLTRSTRPTDQKYIFPQILPNSQGISWSADRESRGDLEGLCGRSLIRTYSSRTSPHHVVIRSTFLGDDQIIHHQFGSYQRKPSWLAERGTCGDLNGIISTRRYSWSAVALRGTRLDHASAVGRFSSSSTSDKPRNGVSEVVGRDGGQESLAEAKAEKLVFDPRNSDADKYYAHLVKATADEVAEKENVADSRMSVWQRFKDLYKKYWYVVVPVHGVLCIGWYGIFYFLAIRGFDVLPLLEKIGISERLLNPLRNSGAGYFASAFAMYKIAGPVRYSVTLGVTTLAIRHLKKLGYIKPMPSTAQMRQFVNEKRLQILSKRKARKSTVKKDTIRKRLAVLFRRPQTSFGKSPGQNGGKPDR